MKFKKIITLLLSVSMLAAVTACGDSDSSSEKKAEKEAIETELVQTKEDSESSDSEAKKDAEVTDASGTIDSDSINDIVNNYDKDHPEDTVMQLLEQGFKNSFKENMRTSYDASSSTYTVEVWQTGFAAALDTDAGASTLESLSGSLESMLETMTTQIRSLDSKAHLNFIFVSDEDQKTPLLKLEDGKMTYNISKN